MNTSSSSTPNHRLLYIIATILSVAIPLIVFTLTRVKFELISAPQVYILPKINAILNATCAVLLIAALFFVKKQQIHFHARFIYTAMLVSLFFLVGYITYHISTDPTSYGAEGISKTIYYILLASHVILAGIQTPFVLFAFVYGYTGQVEKHKKLVKLAYPIWLYVSITGVICYLMISPFYPI